MFILTQTGQYCHQEYSTHLGDSILRRMSSQPELELKKMPYHQLLQEFSLFRLKSYVSLLSGYLNTLHLHNARDRITYMLLAPWSHMTASALTPTFSNSRISDNKRSFSRVSFTVPLEKKNPKGCFQLDPCACFLWLLTLCLYNFTRIEEIFFSSATFFGVTGSLALEGDDNPVFSCLISPLQDIFVMPMNKSRRGQLANARKRWTIEGGAGASSAQEQHVDLDLGLNIPFHPPIEPDALDLSPQPTRSESE
ncbi:hypothetical protein PoB_004130300 [Plakobranchus ocellatus]|uniref:Uncharacterized protein n=1 Tax=Plakobranchus ocellatus TaxID=259542 RepID=A0AAV4B5D1_9GAST|nr:hypothetical protein PoB_004130300 [Plakobranchus ocellatus]